VGEGESADAVGGVFITAGSGGAARVVAHGAGDAFDLLARAIARLFRTPCEHAERERGAGIVVASVRGADKRIDEGSRIRNRLLSLSGGDHHQHQQTCGPPNFPVVTK